jgi:hypothetical protein
MNKVAFISSILGNYETSCKPYVKQTIDCDFICFTDNKNIKSNGWELDLNPYYDTNKSPIDTGLYINSIDKPGRLSEINNRHTFNLAKYYKQQWKLIPRLKDYEVVIWMDGSLELLNENVAEYMLEICSKYQIATWHHELRGGFLLHEAGASYLPKYHHIEYNGQRQPYQDVMRQYVEYIREGYDESFFKEKYKREEGRGRGDHFGVWATGFLAFCNKSENVTDFFDTWYLHILKHTTQDQVSFPKVVQETNLVPYTFPDHIMTGLEAHAENSMFKVHLHGT